MKTKLFKSTLALLACATLIAPVITSCDMGGGDSGKPSTSASSTQESIPPKPTLTVKELLNKDNLLTVLKKQPGLKNIKDDSTNLIYNFMFTSEDATSVDKIFARSVEKENGNIKLRVCSLSKTSSAPLDAYDLANGTPIVGAIVDDGGTPTEITSIALHDESAPFRKAIADHLNIKDSDSIFSLVAEHPDKAAEGKRFFYFDINTLTAKKVYKVSVDTAETFDALAENVKNGHAEITDHRSHDYGSVYKK